MKKLLIFLVIGMVLCIGCQDKKDVDSVDKKSEETYGLYYFVDSGYIGIVACDDGNNDEHISEMKKELEGLELKYMEIDDIESITIPEKIDGYAVYALDGAAFDYCESLKSIYIPGCVEVIEAGAFDGCSEDLIIYGEKDSAAEKFAEEYGFEFLLNNTY